MLVLCIYVLASLFQKYFCREATQFQAKFLSSSRWSNKSKYWRAKIKWINDKLQTFCLLQKLNNYCWGSGFLLGENMNWSRRISSMTLHQTIQKYPTKMKLSNTNLWILQPAWWLDFNISSDKWLIPFLIFTLFSQIFWCIRNTDPVWPGMTKKWVRISKDGSKCVQRFQKGPDVSEVLWCLIC